MTKESQFVSIFAVYLGIGLAGPSHAETAFAVTSVDIAFCYELGEIAASFAEAKNQGLSREALLTQMKNNGVSEEIRDAVANVIYSFESQNTNLYKSYMGALCLQDKLAPIQLE